MKVFIFGDSNVDVTVNWSDVKDQMTELTQENLDLLLDNLARAGKCNCDAEYYLPRRNAELTHFFNSLKPKVEFGGTAAIKARNMAMMGHEVVLYSWVGQDERGSMIIEQLAEAGVDTSHVVVDGKTCETFNIFEQGENRVAFSFWESKLDLQDFIKTVKSKKPDMVFLTGAHRIQKGLGYSKLSDAYVFTGSFVAYPENLLRKKYKDDFSKGRLVGNDAEVMQLSGRDDPIEAMKALRNKIVVMHGAEVTAVKRKDEMISIETEPVDRAKAKELTGIGDVWESFFLGSVDVKTASEEEITSAMKMADRASIHRMLTGKFPTAKDIESFKK